MTNKPLIKSHVGFRKVMAAHIFLGPPFKVCTS